VSRGRGYRPVPKGVREELWHLHPMAEKAGQKSPDRDLTMFAPAVDDQGDVGQCTGQAVGCGDMTTLSAGGTPVDGYLDPQSLYRLARCMERAYGYPWSNGMPPLQDLGADPNLVHLAINRWGCSTLKDTFGYPGPCPELTAAYGQRRNDEPTLGEMEASDAFRMVGQQRVTSTGQQRIDDVRTAISVGFACTMSVYASDARFQSYVGGVMGPAPDGSGCDHLVCVIGDFTDAIGETIFIVQNSWGTEWGQSGRFWAHSKVLLQSDGVHICSVRQS
jgi:hypothetical protein